MNYRPYTPADFDELYGIEEICFQPPLRFPRRYLRRLLENADSTAWIAEEDGKIAGFAVADCGRRDGAGQFAYIETIEVLPDMRGRGIGNELLRRIEESAREKGAGAIWLHVESQNAGRHPLVRVARICVRGQERQLLCERARRPDLPQGAAAARVNMRGV